MSVFETMNVEQQEYSTNDMPERRLWKWVIQQTLKSALSFDKDAIAWFCEESKDRELVFDFANYHTDAEKAGDRLKITVLLFAKNIARGEEPYFNKETNRASWRKPSGFLRAKAISFLESRIGKKLLYEKILSDEKEQENILFNAINFINIGYVRD